MPEEHRTPRFNSLLERWKKKEFSKSKESGLAAQFALTEPKKKVQLKNEEAIREYKKSFEKDKSFKHRAPTRGRSAYNRPAQLKYVFGAKLEDLTDYKAPVYEKTATEISIIEYNIKENFFFDDLEPAALKEFIDALEPTVVSKGTEVIKQGEKGDYFYIIGGGNVSFLIDEQVVGTAEKGGSFGELALLYSSPRAATVRVDTEDTKLFRVESKTFRSLLQNQTKRMESEKRRLLKSIDFLKEVGAIDMRRLARAMRPIHFEPGTCLVKKGEEGDAFYVIQEGELEVTDISVGSTSFEDIVLSAGDYFGERSLVTDEPRAANVTAMTEGLAFSIDKPTFQKILGDFTRVIMKSQDRRVLVCFLFVSLVTWFSRHGNRANVLFS